MTPALPPVAVLGLGPMGAAIARTLSVAGHPVTAWNRTPRPFAELTAAGVTIENDAVTAADGAALVVICVRDHSASRELVAAIRDTVESAIVVNVSTGTPAEATESAALAAAAGLRYVTGAVMVPTALIGTDASLVLYAGDPADVDGATAVLASLGGTADGVSSDHGVPPVLDLAMLDVYFAGIYSFLHATALASAHGIAPTTFLPYAETITDSMKASLPGLADAATDRSYQTGQARLDMCLAFLEKIVASSDEVGVRSDFPAAIRDASVRTLETYSPAADWDAVAEELLPPIPEPAPARDNA